MTRGGDTLRNVRKIVDFYNGALLQDVCSLGLRPRDDSHVFLPKIFGVSIVAATPIVPRKLQLVVLFTALRRET